MQEAFDIKMIRVALHWTQEQLAEYLGCDRSTISRMESGLTPVRRPYALLLSRLVSEKAQAAE